MAEPTRDQDLRCLDLASHYVSVAVDPPERTGDPIVAVCYNRHQKLPGRDDYPYAGLHVAATFTLNEEGRSV